MKFEIRHGSAFYTDQVAEEESKELELVFSALNGSITRRRVIEVIHGNYLHDDTAKFVSKILAYH